jgi:hypothetical protein
MGRNKITKNKSIKANLIKRLAKGVFEVPDEDSNLALETPHQIEEYDSDHFDSDLNDDHNDFTIEFSNEDDSETEQEKEVKRTSTNLNIHNELLVELFEFCLKRKCSQRGLSVLIVGILLYVFLFFSKHSRYFHFIIVKLG